MQGSEDLYYMEKDHHERAQREYIGSDKNKKRTLYGLVSVVSTWTNGLHGTPRDNRKRSSLLVKHESDTSKKPIYIYIRPVQKNRIFFFSKPAVKCLLIHQKRSL